MSKDKFEKAQASLNNQVADLEAKYGDLVAEIQKSGIHYPGFAKLKRTAFALGKVAKQNGLHPERTKSDAKPNDKLFAKPTAEDMAKAGKKSAAQAPPPNIFDRNAEIPSEKEAKKLKNPPPPNIFVRQGPATESKPLPKKKKPAAKPEDVKVLATSEDKDD